MALHEGLYVTLTFVTRTPVGMSPDEFDEQFAEDPRSLLTPDECVFWTHEHGVTDVALELGADPSSWHDEEEKEAPAGCVACAYYGVMRCRETVGTCDRCGRVDDVNMDYSESGDREKPDQTLCLNCLNLPDVHFKAAHEPAMLAEFEQFKARKQLAESHKDDEFDIVQAAALAFLHGNDPEEIDLGELADALDVDRNDVEALVDGAPQHQWEVTTPPEVYLTDDSEDL